MHRFRSHTMRCLIVAVLMVGLVPWVGNAWLESMQTSSPDARAAWLHGQVASWPSEADRKAFERAVHTVTEHAPQTPEAFTKAVLAAYEDEAPEGHTAADLFGWTHDADVTLLARWLHGPASHWDRSTLLSRVSAATVSALSTTRADLIDDASGSIQTVQAYAMLVVSDDAHAEPTTRWLVRRLVAAHPRAP